MESGFASNMKINETGDISTIRIILSSSLYFQSGIRDFTLEVVRNLTGLPDQWAYRFQTIVDEMCNNAIEHGSNPTDDIALTFRLKKEDWFEVQVEDQGKGKDALPAKELTRLIEERKALKDTDIHGLRGRGLARIVAKWTDELEFSDRPEGGLCARARKYFSKLT